MVTQTLDAAATPRPGPRKAAAVHLFIIMALTALLALPLSPGEVVGGGYGPKLFLLGRMVALVVVATLLLRSAGRRWSDVGLRRPARWWSVPLAVALGYGAVGAVVAGLQLVVLPAMGLAAPDHGQFAALKGDLPEYLFWALPVALGSAAVGEELVARGFLTDRIATLLGGARPGWLIVLAAVILQGLMFGACHVYQGLGGAIATAGVGIVLGLVWLFTGRNLWAGIALHGLVDVVSMTAFYTGVAGAGS
ncbi:MAG: CPBP family intramembrane metalloprotease [Caulobacter sp.]|nr:CPBP family intramembrane metalloprotease [Caulobacter sp.]